MQIEGGGLRCAYPLAKIGELASYVGSGVTPLGGSAAYRAEGIPFIRSQNVHFDGLELSDVAYIDAATHASMSRSEVFGHDVLLNITGASIGRCCVVPASAVPANVNQHVCAIRLDPASSSDARYLYAVLASPIGQMQIDRLNAGGNREGLNYQQIRAFVVPWPSARIRHMIAEVLDAVDETIRKTEEVIAKLQQMKQGLLHDLLTRGIDDNGELRDPERHPEQFKDSELGMRPVAWSISPLGRQVVLQRGFDITVAEQRSGPFPVVSSSGITSYHDVAKVQGPGVVIGRKGKLGGAYYIEGPFWPHDTTLWGKCFFGNLPEFVSLYLRWMRLERFDAATSVPTLNRNFVHPVLVSFPPPPEQFCIVKIARGVDVRLASEEVELSKLRQLKSALADDLLTGRVRVPTSEPPAP